MKKYALVSGIVFFIIVGCSIFSSSQEESHRYDGFYSIYYYENVLGQEKADKYEIQFEVRNSTGALKFLNKEKKIIELPLTVDKDGQLEISGLINKVRVHAQGQINSEGIVVGNYSIEGENTIEGKFDGKKISQSSYQDNPGVFFILMKILAR